MSVRTFSLILSMSSLTLGVAACGGDDGGGGGEETLPTTSADTSAGSAMTMTTEEPTTMDPTEEPTTEDPTEEPTTDPTVDPDTSTGDVPAGPAAFRLNSVAVRDPHFFVNIVGDITESQVNGPLSSALNSDDPEMPDGFYDLGFVLAFDPLDQSDGGGGGLIFANAQCAVGADPSACGLLPTTMEYATTFTSQAAGTCQSANPANLTASYTPAPGMTTGPCFVTTASSVTIATSSFSLPLENATVAARYVGEPAGNLVEGTIIGWVSNAAADAALLADDLPLVGGQPLSALLEESARDDGDTGWWFHIDFTAVPATYNG